MFVRLQPSKRKHLLCSAFCATALLANIAGTLESAGSEFDGAEILSAPQTPRSDLIAPLPKPALTVTLAPPGAIAAGGRWRLAGESTWRESGVQYSDLPTGLHFLEFKPISGWIEPPDDRIVRITEGVTQLVGPAEYQPLPRFPITVTASTGGTVVQQNWQPIGSSGVYPIAINEGHEGLSREWESAIRNLLRMARMPAENAGVRVRLHALPHPGYRFAGWTGAATGSRNPLTFIVNGPRTIRAAFEKAAPWTVASHAAETYASPGTVAVHCQFNYTPGDQLQSLVWRPELPPGWKLAGASGLGHPVLEQEEVHFAGPLGSNPIQFNLILEVPAGESGAKQLTATIEYRLAGDESAVVRPVRSLGFGGELVLEPSTSPAARLEFNTIHGRPVLTLRGEVGRTYAIEELPVLFTSPPLHRLWWFLKDVTLTNSLQTTELPEPLPGSMSNFYRAVLVE